MSVASITSTSRPWRCRRISSGQRPRAAADDQDVAVEIPIHQNIPSMRFNTCLQNFAMSFGSSKKFAGLIAIRSQPWPTSRKLGVQCRVEVGGAVVGEARHQPAGDLKFVGAAPGGGHGAVQQRLVVLAHAETHEETVGIGGDAFQQAGAEFHAAEPDFQAAAVGLGRKERIRELPELTVIGGGRVLPQRLPDRQMFFQPAATRGAKSTCID